VPFIARALDDVTSEVRLHAATSVLRLAVEPSLRARAEGVLADLASDPDAGIRVAVLQQIASGALPDPVATRLVGDALADGSEVVRASALRAARDRMCEALATGVSAQLEDAAQGVREAAAEALGILFSLLGERGGTAVEGAISALLGALGDPAPEVRWAAARGLGLIGAPVGSPVLAESVVTALSAALERADDREAAVFGLFGQGERGVRAALGHLDAIGDPERLAAHIALLGPPAIPLLAELLEDPRAHRVALAALRRLGARAMPLAEAIALLVRQGGATAREAALTLAAFGPPALPVLARLLEEPVARGPAAAAVPALGAVAANLVPDLAVLANGPQPERLDAIGALVAIGPDALPELSALLDHGGYRVRRALLGVLAEAPEEALFALPLQALFDPHPKIRAAAARALGCWGEVARPVAGELVGLLGDDHPQVRAGAVWALGEIGRGRCPDPFVRPWAPPDIGDALRGLHADPHPRVRQEAAIALRKLDLG